MEQSVLGLEQHEQSYTTFHNLFLVKICILFARTQFLLKMIFLIFFPLYISNATIWNLWSQILNTFLKSDVA